VLRVCERWLNWPRDDDTTPLWTADGWGIGRTEITKCKFEWSRRRQDNKKGKSKPDGPDHVEPPLLGSRTG